MSDQRQEQPDDSEPTSARQAELQAAYEKNLAEGRPPYAGVQIRTRDEIAWIMAERTWSGEEDEYTVKYHLVPQGASVQRANFANAWLADINLAGMRLRRANLTGANLVRAELAGADLVDADLSDADLGFANMSGANLTWANLSGAHMREVSLHDARMVFANLCGAGLARCNLRGADLRNARMDASTLLGDVMLDAHTQVRDVTWNGASLTQIDWESIQHLGDEDMTQLRASSDHRKMESRLTRLQGAARAYQQLAVVLRSQGISDAAARMGYRAQVLQRRVFFRRKRPIRWFGSLLLDCSSGYGYKPMRSIIAYVVIICLFAGTYLLNGQFAAPHLTWDESLVLSISSFHGRGFFTSGVSLGDTLARLAAGEAIIGLLIEITFIATFTNRFFAR